MVEGRWTAEGHFKATQILAKHSEEYKAPHDAKEARPRSLLKTLETGAR